MPPTQYTQFAAAARRHVDDAQDLYARRRFANADHIAGFAAECGLKAILIDYLGGVLASSGKPTHHAKPSGHWYGHLPGLQSELATTAHGLTAAQFTKLIGGPNPFSAWSVHERYSDGTHIGQQRVNGHLTNARRIVGLHQQAAISGGLP